MIDLKEQKNNGGVLGKLLKKTLIFSADRELCQSLSLFFEDIYEVISTTDADKIVNEIIKTSPDVLIIDLPKVDKEMLEILREAKKIKSDTHIILMFSYSNKETDVILSAMRTAIDAIFYKPVDITQLANTVGKVLLNK